MVRKLKVFVKFAVHLTIVRRNRNIVLSVGPLETLVPSRGFDCLMPNHPRGQVQIISYGPCLHAPLMAAYDVTRSRYLRPGNGSSKSTEPASSILAAQLAPHLSSQVGQGHHLDRETFSQLRHELLKANCNQLRFDDNVADVNKLICVVLKAGLEHGPKDKLSIANDEVEGRISDCLDIIQAAVEKAPQALVEISDPELLGKVIHAPLYVWLLIRLIELSCNWCQEHIQERIHGLLSTIVCSQYKQSREWQARYSIADFLRVCAMGM